MANPAPASWELATPIFGIRYPRPTAPAKYLPDAFSHVGNDLEGALTAGGAVPPGFAYTTGTRAQRLAVAAPANGLIWIETDQPGNPRWIGTGSAWIALGVAPTIADVPDASPGAFAFVSATKAYVGGVWSGIHTERRSGVAFLTGALQASAAVGAGNTLGTVPVGWRPLTTYQGVGESNGAITTIVVKATGEIYANRNMAVNDALTLVAQWPVVGS